MPVLGGAVTFARFRWEPGKKPPSDTRRWLAKGLASGAFEPLDPAKGDEERAAGFVELEDQDATSFASIIQGEYALFAFRVDTLKVPAAALRVELERWRVAFEKEHGRPPAKREKAERKEAVRHLLRQRATPSSHVHDVSLNLKAGQVQIWAASRKAVDEVVAALETALEVKLAPLTPAALAARAGTPDAALAPTPELVGLESSRREVSDVEA
ncbi:MULTISPECIES: recombination-associated protein RdgC [Anaeromyxobacter]|uniref:recombination-associated protein RdgC n=1 Tax=Anaeromyxobacter TaxID=161492 RepID=UPI001F5624FD|nr:MULTISPECIES: recombination-associated protein RdgC [unclassified Anaeromyxobacter]